MQEWSGTKLIFVFLQTGAPNSVSLELAECSLLRQLGTLPSEAWIWLIHHNHRPLSVRRSVACDQAIEISMASFSPKGSSAVARCRRDLWVFLLEYASRLQVACQTWLWQRFLALINCKAPSSVFRYSLAPYSRMLFGQLGARAISLSKITHHRLTFISWTTTDCETEIHSN